MFGISTLKNSKSQFWHVTITTLSLIFALNLRIWNGLKSDCFPTWNFFSRLLNTVFEVISSSIPITVQSHHCALMTDPIYWSRPCFLSIFHLRKWSMEQRQCIPVWTVPNLRAWSLASPVKFWLVKLHSYHQLCSEYTWYKN